MLGETLKFHENYNRHFRIREYKSLNPGNTQEVIGKANDCQADLGWAVLKWFQEVCVCPPRV